MKKLDLENENKILERRVFELKSQLAHSEYFFEKMLEKCSVTRLKGSAVILSLDFLGRDDTTSVSISDGLSDETIKAIKKDLVRSFELKTMWKPLGE